MFHEFIFPYHKQVAEQFGLTCYACCEPADPFWDDIKQLHNLRRVSVSQWANAELLGIINFAAQIMMCVSIPFIGIIINKLSKRSWAMIGDVLIAAGSLIVVINPTNIPLIWVGSFMRGLGTAPIYTVMFTMITDAIEYEQWKTGLRTPGAIQSAVTSGQKFGQGIGSAMIGFIMQELLEREAKINKKSYGFQYSFNT